MFELLIADLAGDDVLGGEGVIVVVFFGGVLVAEFATGSIVAHLFQL